MKAAGDIDSLINALKHSDEKIQQNAMDALAEIGEPAVGQLIQSLRDDDYSFYELVERTLAKVGASALEPLILALQDQDEHMRYRAVKSLEELFNVVQYSPWKSKDKDLAIKPLIELLKRDSDLIREAVAKALRRIGPPAVNMLIETLTDEDAKVRFYSAMALWEIRDERKVEPLIKALDDDNKAVRMMAVRGLGESGDKRAVKPLEKLHKKKKDADFNGVLIKALKQLGVPMIIIDERTKRW